MSLRRYIPKSVKQAVRRAMGDRFQNHGAISELDFAAMREEIDRVRPAVFIEIGTGTGVSTRRLFAYLKAAGIACEFYTIELFEQHFRAIAAAIADPRFHPIHGLSVTVAETTDPARAELADYRGPQNVLRDLLRRELAGKPVDMAFIDSRKGSALAEFKALAERLAPDGAVFCHDILNGGKGVEVLTYLQDHEASFRFRVIDTGPDGIIRVRRR
jgi:predicted O-methyltransferase YrrM